MKIRYQCKLLLITLGLLAINPVHPDNLGRIFTTAEERQKLEKIRQAKPEQAKIEIKEVKIAEEAIEPPKIEKETIIRESITLKGLVHRSGGKSTAWVNDSNTLEGDLDSQFIQVPNSKIKSDKVTIIMPDDDTNIELSVGEVFTPEPIERDIVEAVSTGDDE